VITPVQPDEDDDERPENPPIQVCKGCNGLGELLVVFATARGGFVPACRSCDVCGGEGRTVLRPPV